MLDKIEKIKTESKEFCKDKTKPLDERWKVVLEVGDITPATIDFGFPIIKEVLDNNYLYLERWQVYSVESLLRDLIGDEYLAGTQPTIDKFKEYCCDNFISKMQFSNFVSLK